jgi:putative two-component system response regulator
MAMRCGYTWEEIQAVMKMAQEEYDVVRLVNPVRRRICDASNNLETDEICGSIWGRCERCENCTSVRALQTKRNAYKIEFADKKAFFVVSRYVEIDEKPRILELVADVTKDFMAEDSQRDRIARFINSHNDMLVTDPLTRLYNRRFLDEHFVPSLTCCHEEHLTVNVAILDLDDFKATNDQYGHQAGDYLLKDVASFWKLHFNSREKNKERLVIRYGGDEMLIIGCGLPGQEFQQMIAKHYQEMRKICYYKPEVHFSFSMSFGVASSEELPPDTWEWEQLFDLADHRLYAGKDARKKAK